MIGRPTARTHDPNDDETRSMGRDRHQPTTSRDEGPATTGAPGSAKSVAAAAGLVAVLALHGMGTVLAARGVGPEDELRRLRAENAALKSDLRSTEARLADVSRSMDELAERDERFRVLVGLPLLDPEVREVGVGGPDAGPEVSESGRRLRDLEKLVRRADLLAASLDEATDSARLHRDVFLSRPSVRPVAAEQAWISSGFNPSRYHPILQNSRPHEGIDISAPAGAEIRATARGTIRYVGTRPGYGKLIEIDHGYGYRTRYAHASRILVRVGDRVDRGDVVGEVGQTGLSTAPNLHYEVLVRDRPVDPRPYLLDDRPLP